MLIVHEFFRRQREKLRGAGAGDPAGGASAAARRVDRRLAARAPRLRAGGGVPLRLPPGLPARVRREVPGRVRVLRRREVRPRLVRHARAAEKGDAGLARRARGGGGGRERRGTLGLPHPHRPGPLCHQELLAGGPDRHTLVRVRPRHPPGPAAHDGSARLRWHLRAVGVGCGQGPRRRDARGEDHRRGDPRRVPQPVDGLLPIHAGHHLEL
mmetsp:Transcript_35595/g.100054  ORF Transcript_35595/g.100054 Transcript_35595/m.100054 type:complete len:212 (+) Transcript_35595:464-1099(+)